MPRGGAGKEAEAALADPRFSDLFKDPMFALDPTDPR